MRGRGAIRSSLRLNLMAWLFVPVAAILGVSLWLSYATAERQATLIMDRQLLASSRMIAEQTRWRSGGIQAVVPPAALELFATDSHDEVSYAVSAADGTLIAGFPELEPPGVLPPGADLVQYNTLFRTEQMRAVILRQTVITPSGTAQVHVMVGETLKARDALARSLWLRGFLEQAALVLAAAVSIWIGITRELRPMMRLRREVLDRPADRFEPFDVRAVQLEIQPLVQALNDHMARLAAYLDRQRRFLDSAAHQLRTPLTILKTQVGFARRDRSATGPANVLAEIDESLSEMTRLTNQLLALGRVEHDRARLAVERVDLRAVVREVATRRGPDALDAHVDLVVEAETECDVAASAALVHEALANLVDNAILHAGAGAVVTIRVARAAPFGAVTVSDTGPGVSDADRARLFQRFQRGHGAAAGGSGLGLAIVAEIAEMFGGSASLAPGGPGFAVTVRLPLAE